jgi:HSP20 family protein
MPRSRTPQSHETIFPLSAVTGIAVADERPWLTSDEGRLAVDVLDDEDAFVVTAAIAGVGIGDLEVFAHHDLLTIRGRRTPPDAHASGRHLAQECHWGAFSRSVILPTEINPSAVSAKLKNGVLTIRLPKTERSRRIKIDVR